MVSLLILKHVRNLSDESVVEQWFENIYYQYFSGERTYACGAPCEASELVHFRNRIGEEGIELILKESIRVNGKDGGEKEATTDTTVQEKNITYTRTMKGLLMELRFRNHPKNKGRARKAERKVKTIAGRLVRELERKLAPGLHQDTLGLFKKVLLQKKSDSNPIM